MEDSLPAPPPSADRSNDWVEFDGTVSVRKIWEGRAQLEEIEADSPMGRFEGLTLFLYNPQSHQWSQYFANSSIGVLDQPAIGEFKSGRGEFYDQEPSTVERFSFDWSGRISLRTLTVLSNRSLMMAAKREGQTSSHP